MMMQHKEQSEYLYYTASFQGLTDGTHRPEGFDFNGLDLREPSGRSAQGEGLIV
jgi:hypothetical protein